MSFAGAEGPQLLPHQVPAFQGNALVAMASTGSSDRNLTVHFWSEPRYQDFLSEQSGTPIYKDVIFVEIEAPGAKSNHRRIAIMQDRGEYLSDPHRFPRQWQAFQNQQEQVQDGVPLSMCKFIAPSRAMELKARGIHTAEQYAAIPDSTMQDLGLGGLRERELCKAFLNDDVKHAQLSAALARETALLADVAAMKAQIAMLASNANGVTAQPIPIPIPQMTQEFQQLNQETEARVKRGPGRPKKDNSDV